MIRKLKSGAYRLYSRKAICEYFHGSVPATVLVWNKTYKISRLRVRATVSGAVKSKKSAFLISGGELITGIKKQIIRSPMRRKTNDGLRIFFSVGNFNPITAILWIQ